MSKTGFALTWVVIGAGFLLIGVGGQSLIGRSPMWTWLSPAWIWLSGAATTMGLTNLARALKRQSPEPRQGPRAGRPIY